MRAARKLALILWLGVGAAIAQKHSAIKADSGAPPAESDLREASAKGSLTEDDRLSVIAAALNSKLRDAEPDCSHLVHAIYQQAGFSYPYAPSSDLYAGVEGFQRVKKPEPVDLVVWRGHVGIVIKPSRHLFFSVLSTGAGVDDYTARYWKHRGQPRFYRFVKTASLKPHPLSPQLVRTNRVRSAAGPSDEPNDR